MLVVWKSNHLKGTAVKSLASFLVVSLILSGAALANEPLHNDRIILARAGTPEVCTEIYQPVCGTKHGKRVSYSNACFARVARATKVSPGACPK